MSVLVVSASFIVVIVVVVLNVVMLRLNAGPLLYVR